VNREPDWLRKVGVALRGQSKIRRVIERA